MNNIWGLMEQELGHNDHNMDRNRPYNGQAHTSSGERGKTEIKNITFRDLRDCYIRAVCLSMGIENPIHYDEACKGEKALLSENDLFDLKGDFDWIAIEQNLSCEIEKIMGIFPNVPNLSCEIEKIMGIFPNIPKT